MTGEATSGARIAIVGIGAMGGYFGAHMLRAGEDAVLIDAWPENVEAIRRDGLRVAGMVPADNFTVAAQPLHITDVQGLIRARPIDIAFIAMKSYDTVWATQLIIPYLAPDGCVVSFQNGVNESVIAGVAGRERTLGCAIASLAGELVGPGHVRRMTAGGKGSAVIVGEMEGPASPRVDRIIRAVSHAETSYATDNLAGVKWSKLVINAMRNGLSAMTGMSGHERDMNPVTRSVGIRLGGQTVEVGRALGLRLENTGFDFDVLVAASHGDEAAIGAITQRMMEVLATRSSEQRPSMGQDIRRGRRTETDAINGLVARLGREHGIDTTLHQRVHETILRIERGEIAPSPALAEGL